MASFRLSALSVAATLLVAAGLGACHSSGSSASASSSGMGGIFSSTRQVQIMDPALNMVAYTLTIPRTGTFRAR